MRRRKIALCGSIIAARGGSAGPWTPASLGASLFEWWDAENASSVPQSAGTVQTWTGLVAGVAPTQGTSSKRPIWSATSFNNRPSITFDGSDDVLLASSSGNMPSGATPGWIWVLASQDALVADATQRSAFSHGTISSGTSRGLRRSVIALNSPSTNINNVGQGYTGADYSGRHLACLKVGATATTMVMDGVLLTGSLAIVPATGTGSATIGASAPGSASFWQGAINSVLVTDVLSGANETLLTSYLMARM